MSGLRALLDYTVGGDDAGTFNYNTLRVYNTNTTTADNGGECCLFTVPAGVTWFAVELWGGGGSGAGACCCFQGWPGGSGSYSRKFITGLTGTGGEEYTVCAGSSTVCADHFCCGCPGFPSFVAENGGDVLVCASGGSNGLTRCNYGDNCSQSGCATYECGSGCGTMVICGITGSGKGSPNCQGNTWQLMPSAPFTYGSNRGTKDACSGYCGGCCAGGYAHFPGGGGASAAAHTSTQFCGAAGAGGLVSIYYPILTT